MKRKRISRRAGRRMAYKCSRISTLGSIKRGQTTMGGRYL